MQVLGGRGDVKLELSWGKRTWFLPASASKLGHFRWRSACLLMASGGCTQQERKPTSCPGPSTAHPCPGVGSSVPIFLSMVAEWLCEQQLCFLYRMCHTPVTGRNRLSRDDGRRMSARNLKRSSSLSRSASCQIQIPQGKGAESSQDRWGPRRKRNLCFPPKPLVLYQGHLFEKVGDS